MQLTTIYASNKSINQSFLKLYFVTFYLIINYIANITKNMKPNETVIFPITLDFLQDENNPEWITYILSHRALRYFVKCYLKEANTIDYFRTEELLIKAGLKYPFKVKKGTELDIEEGLFENSTPAIFNTEFKRKFNRIRKMERHEKSLGVILHYTIIDE